MPTVRHRVALLCSVLAAVVVSGCGSGAGVSGTVNIDGQPVADGGIVFFPAGSKDPAATGRIIGGKYEVARNPKLVAGTYKVQINWLKATGKKLKNENDIGTEIEETYEAIPSQYNTGSNLSVELSSGSNRKDFDLKGMLNGPTGPAGGGGQKKGGAPKALGDS